MKKIKTLLISLVTLVILATASITLVGCGNSQALSFTDAYNYSAIAGIGILDTNQADQGASGYSANGALSQQQKDDIIGNLAIAQNLANNGLIKTAVTQSDKDGYEYFYTVTATDYTGTEKVYSFYYNRIEITEFDDDDDDRDEQEQEFRLEGLVVLDGIEYNMVGNQEIEQDEAEFSFTISIDNGNKVIIEQETESNEMEFSYTAYKNGIKVFEQEIEYEVGRNGNIELQFEILDRANGVATEIEYEFFTVDNQQFATVKVQNGRDTEVLTTVKIIQTENGFDYIFINN